MASVSLANQGTRIPSNKCHALSSAAVSCSSAGGIRSKQTCAPRCGLSFERPARLAAVSVPGWKSHCGALSPLSAVVMVKCGTCNRTAPSKPPCPRGMCGRCCPQTAPCDARNHHKPRRKVRGVVGKGSVSRKNTAWKEAHARCRHLWRKDRMKTLSRVLDVTPAAMFKATMRAILTEARARLGHAPLGDSAGAQAAESAEDMAVALLVSPQAQAEAVRNVLDSTTLRKFLEEEDNDNVIDEPWEPDWDPLEETAPDDADDLRDDVPSSSSLVPAGSGSAATASSMAWLGGEEALAPLAPAAAAASSSTTAWLGGPDQPLRTSLQKRQESSSNVEKPWVVFNKEGRPCAHWERKHPPYAQTLHEFDIGGYAYNVDVPFKPERFFQFFQKYDCGDNLLDMREARFPWTASGDAVQLLRKPHEPGRWFRFQLREPRPRPAPRTDISNPLVWSHPDAGYIRCMHCTCMYNVPKLLREGLVPGPNSGKGTTHEVYCYPMEGAALATKSSGYCIYTSPFEDGWLWGARCEMQVAKGWSWKRKLAVGAAQLAAWEGSYSMTALWVHVMHEQEVRKAYGEQVVLYYQVDKWNPIYVEP